MVFNDSVRNLYKIVKNGNLGDMTFILFYTIK